MVLQCTTPVPGRDNARGPAEEPPSQVRPAVMAVLLRRAPCAERRVAAAASP